MSTDTDLSESERQQVDDLLCAVLEVPKGSPIPPTQLEKFWAVCSTAAVKVTEKSPLSIWPFIKQRHSNSGSETKTTASFSNKRKLSQTDREKHEIALLVCKHTKFTNES